MTNANNSIRHGEMMYELGRAFGADDARSAVLHALFTAKHRTLTEDEINAVIAKMDVIYKTAMDEYMAIFNERASALA
jgi:hypothetical protein